MLLEEEKKRTRRDRALFFSLSLYSSLFLLEGFHLRIAVSIGCEFERSSEREVAVLFGSLSLEFSLRSSHSKAATSASTLSLSRVHESLSRCSSRARQSREWDKASSSVAVRRRERERKACSLWGKDVSKWERWVYSSTQLVYILIYSIQLDEENFNEFHYLCQYLVWS